MGSTLAAVACGTALAALVGCGGVGAAPCGGAPCALDGDPCHTGATDCAGVCRPSRNAAAGTACGVNGFCDGAGSCGACTLAAECDEGIAPCHAGAVACDTGAPVCQDAGHLPEGTACTDGPTRGYCSGGTCVPCKAAGDACGDGGRCARDGTCVYAVTGSARITYWPEGGGTVDVGNCFGQHAEVLVRVKGGSYTLLSPAAGQCTSTSYDFTFPTPVPAGAYLLHFFGSAAFDYYLETTRPTLDFGRDQAGRPDQNVVANASTQVTFGVSGLDPWVAGADALDFTCANAGIGVDVAGSGAGLADLMAGATSGAAAFDWLAQPLVDPGKGDVAWIHQLSAKPTTTPGMTILAATRAAKLQGFAVAEGVPASASAALAAPGATGTFQATWATSQFEALEAAANPGYAPGAHVLSVEATRLPAIPGGYVPASAQARLLVAAVQAGAKDQTLGTLEYGRFLGAPWAEVLLAKFDMHATYLAKGASSPAVRYVGIYQQDLLPLPPGATVAPRLGPPRRPLVAGRDGTVPQGGVSRSPEISWLPPTRGAPDYYAVTVQEVAPDAAHQGTVVTGVAMLLTPFPRIVVPPGVLIEGHTYFAVVAALLTPSVPYGRAPLRLGIPSAVAETATAEFTP